VTILTNKPKLTPTIHKVDGQTYPTNVLDNALEKKKKWMNVFLVRGIWSFDISLFLVLKSD
jgi:hypothetical protein